MSASTEHLRVAYVGNFRPRHSTENHVALSLRALGHEVEPFQEDELHAYAHGGWPTLAERVVAEKCDLLLWTRTWQHEHPDEQEDALDALRGVEIPTVSYHLDLYVGLDREEQIGREPFWRTDVVCTADGALSDDEWRSRFNIEHRWVRAGVLAEECVRGTRRAEFVSDVAFVGSHARYHVEWPYRQELLRSLSRAYGSRRFKLWPRGRNAVRNEALNDLYASAKVIVGDSLCLGFDRPRYWSDRVYETVGRGGFLVMPWIEGLDDELRDGEHLRYYRFGDFAELRSIIDYYLDPAHEAERLAIVERGMQRVRERCTYTHRVQEVLDHVNAQPRGSDRSSRLLPARLNGQRLRVELRPGTTDAEVFADVWDERTYRSALDFLPDGIVVDVGANVGAFTLWALAKGAQHVVAYEPEPGNFAQLVKNTTGLAVTPKQLAVASVAQVLAFAPGPEGLHGGGTHVVEALSDAALHVDAAAVDRVLSDALALDGEIAVLKLDVEGAEYDIIEGVSGDLLGRVRCIVMEFHGPGMPHLAHLQVAKWGPMVSKLAEHGHVTVMGRPSVGGVITWRRY